MLYRDSKVRIFNKEGKIVREILLPEEVLYTGKKRVSKGVKSGLYYKGAGCEYKGHYAVYVNGCEVTGRADIEYYGWKVMRKEWLGKFGIFQESYQPCFSDWIGGCGIKERKIVENSGKFKRSGVEVIDVIDIGGEHAVYVLRYLHSRDNKVDLDELMKTLVYMLREGWNFAWDKNVLGDIDDNGYVTDVADLFRGDDLKSKFGTAYAVFYSIMQDERLRKEFFEEYKVELKESILPFAVYMFLKRIGIDVGEIGEMKLNKEDYERLMRDYIINGKPCAGLEDEKWGEIARQYYFQKLMEALNHGN